MILFRNTYLRNGNFAHDRLDMVMFLKVELLACSSFFLPPPFSLLSPFLSSYLGVISDFWLSEGGVGRELERKREENGFVCFLFSFFLSCFLLISLSLFLYALAENELGVGGVLCFLFPFLLLSCFQKSICIYCLSNLVLVVLLKPCER